jgi:hypothetical protein
MNALQLVGEPPCGVNADEPVLIRMAGVIPYSTGYQERWMWRLPGQEAQAPPGGEGAAETSSARVELPQGAEGAQGTPPDPRARPGGNAEDAAGRSAL